MHAPTTTIAAIATSGQSCAIGIVRISGPGARAVLDRVVPNSRASRRPRRVCFGHAIDPSSGQPIDDVLCFFCQGPASSTGEDVAEIHGHGGAAVMAELLSACLTAGCALANPGEFTYRAVCHGRLDLAQAEAVATLIGARTERAARMALGQLHGGLQAAIEPLLHDLLTLCAEIEASLDFPEDEVEAANLSELALRARALATAIEPLETSYQLGQRLTQGATAALIGPVNAGKSSLLNALCGQPRAIVDAEPGTTRDIVRATVDCGGIAVEVLDTAGLRQAPGRIEQAGIERTHDAVLDADVVVMVVDGAAPPQQTAAQLQELFLPPGLPAILAVNKADLPGFELTAALPSFTGPRLALSAERGQGLRELTAALTQALGSDEAQTEPPMVGSARQHEALRATRERLQIAAALLAEQAEPELAAHELQRARASLGAVLGRDVTEDLLERIFSSFCIGK